MNFAVDGHMRNQSYFSAWMQSIIPHDGDGLVDTSSQYGASRPYELAYKNEYATNIEVMVLSDADETPIAQFQIQEAFPSNMNAIPLAWAQNDAYATFSVFFDYLSWKQTNKPGNPSFKR